MYEFELLKLQILPDQGFGKVIDNIGAVLKEAPSTDAEQMELLVNLEKALQGKRAASFPTAIAIQEVGHNLKFTFASKAKTSIIVHLS